MSDQKIVPIDNIEYIGCSTKDLFTVEDNFNRNNNFYIENTIRESNDKSLFMLGKNHYYISLPHKEHKFTVNEDSSINCPFCKTVLEVHMIRAFRMINAPMIPTLNNCYCDGWKHYSKRLSDKTLRLLHENFKCLDSQLYISLYEGTLFIWSKFDVQSHIFQSEKFRNYVMSDSIGFINDLSCTINISNRLKLANIMERFIPESVKCPGPVFGSEILTVPYDIDLDRDIDKLIKKAKEDAMNQKCEFFFPPPDRKPDNMLFTDKYEEIKVLQTPELRSHAKLFDLFQVGRGILPSNFDFKIDTEHKNKNDVVDMNINFIVDKVLAINFLKFCSIGVVCSMYKTNKWWREICRNDMLWKVLIIRDFKKDNDLQFGGYRELYKHFYLNREKPETKIRPCNKADSQFSEINFAHDLLSQNLYPLESESESEKNETEESEESDEELNVGDMGFGDGAIEYEDGAIEYEDGGIEYGVGGDYGVFEILNNGVLY